ncbi:MULTISPECIES: DUF927 domain-containing protein [unclassified Mammaliicoccus]|uniref:cassette chromosome replicative helicase n=1 Tax=unclassified Mammaliicoccus TaxID=2803851 RepID=UPI001EFA94F6|nr:MULTISPECIES: DUF927 domain-containing protein [unclassified Mammaliicoccus]HDF4598087.1 DUF927 domain-containing protein [Staphylococcus aureus]HDF5118358.1 DUF927 domain-containing protein [Staphylococcus aureus]HDF5119088.1 DUF927 domain-containing protein [Staphylococcus aureus]
MVNKLNKDTIFERKQFKLTKDGWSKENQPTTKDGKITFTDLGGYINITDRFQDPTSGKERLILENEYGNTVIRDADILTPMKLPSLMGYGFTINTRHIHELGYALQLMRENLPMATLYSGSGVISTKDGLVINTNYIEYHPSIPQNTQILCDGKYDLEPKGSYAQWLLMYDAEVKGHLMLEMAVTMGVSALVTSYLNKIDLIEFGGTIYSLTGQSSAGKTTAAMLAISVGAPTKGTNTLLRSWNTTRNGLEGFINENYGILVAFDELSTATFPDTTGLLYSIAEGQGRQRANVHGEAKETKTWSTSLISTSEYSIFSNSAKNDGLYVRTIELNDVFTHSADNADNIKLGVRQNYGHVLPLIGSFLLNHENTVRTFFEEEQQWFKHALSNEKEKTGQRMFNRYAVFVTSARILSSVTNRTVLLDEMREYLLNYHNETIAERSLAEKSIEVIVQFVAQYRNKFSDDDRLSIMLESYGLIELRDDHIQVKIIASVFKKMLEEHQFQDVNNVIDALRDKGYMQSDRNRKTTKRSVKDTKGQSKTLVFYHLKIDKSYASIFGLRSNSEPFTPPQFDGNTNPDLLNEFVKQAKEKEKNDDLGL